MVRQDQLLLNYQQSHKYNSHTLRANPIEFSDVATRGAVGWMHFSTNNMKSVSDYTSNVLFIRL